MAFNRAILIGRLTADPELRTTPGGKHVTSFTVAVDRYGKEGEKKADFITVAAWEKRAEFVSRYFGKGDAIGIEGSITTRNYEDKNGNKRTAVEVLAGNVFFAGGRKDRAQAEGEPAQAPETDFEETDEDLPF